ncbi:MAG TPA: LLM class F420-dependent oxidoreductase [Candidatus Dormibacteraeota bacterium]|jgi:F420-dependent oxidoreductase-like protein|nr:LLM class F420-dependent oxidoreductase [Candidatus Dormibacteraeota bacterium]
MKLGIHVSDYTWPGGPPRLGADLRTIAQASEAAGFDRLSVMDHFWQIRHLGPPEHEMLEAYTTLGYVAGVTSRIKLLTVVTGVIYRLPGLLAKAVTTLDVLSGGRAMLGIGAAWNEEESRGLGFPFPPLAVRFEMLEEALQIVLQMWSDDDGPYHGKHYQLERTLNSPQPLQKPHPPILIGGSGERKTLRLVAQYADACNIFGAGDVPHKLDVLRQHCEQLGRDYDAIEKTVIATFDVGENGERTGELVEQCREYAALGIQEVHGTLRHAHRIAPIEAIGRDVIPVIAEL